LDGEMVAWEAGRQRTSFALLQRRVTTGRVVQEVRRHPAYVVIFDLLQAPAEYRAPTRDRPSATAPIT
jgi:ATP-dependent DNA ligase